MTTYTIAYGPVLYVCVPDGDVDAFERELMDAEEQSREALDHAAMRIVSGLILTDDMPEDEERVVWRGHDLGWLTDEHGVPYRYAVRPL